MAKVSVVMGSDSDMPIMAKAVEILEKFGVDYEIRIISAHREPDIFVDYAKTAKDRLVFAISSGVPQATILPPRSPPSGPKSII